MIVSLLKRLGIALVVLLVAHASAGAGSTVRGRLYRVDSQGRQSPASGIAVSVNHPKHGRSSYVYSGADGMYHLYNIPPDTFTLEVWVSRKNPLAFRITVRDQEYTDIAPIRLP